jgi:UDP-glucuronate 4-epimerase
MQGMQAGDVTATWANVDDLINKFNYKPDTTIQTGLKNFAEWYKKFYSDEQLSDINEELAGVIA